MFTRIARIGALALVLFPLGAQAQPAPPEQVRAEQAFKAANALMEERDYVAALAQFRIVLEVAPDDPSVLWNAGSAAFFARDYPTATTLLAQLRKQEPSNGHLIAKQIQTAEASRDLRARDAFRTQILALHKSKQDSTGYTKKPSFCRDQFAIGANSVLAYEHFVLTPRSKVDGSFLFGVRYDFIVQSPDDKRIARVEVGWNSLAAKPDGTFVRGDEMSAFYFDAYYPSGEWERKTFDLMTSEPNYDAVKARIVAIMGGKVPMISGRKRAPKG